MCLEEGRTDDALTKSLHDALDLQNNVVLPGAVVSGVAMVTVDVSAEWILELML